MAYSSTVSALKSLLDSYSEDENALSQRYKEALASAKTLYEKQVSDAEAQYKKDRNDAAYDALREEKDVMNVLAHRGLGSSGEVEQAKLNSGIILNNRLGELKRKKADTMVTLASDYSDKNDGLGRQMISDLGDIKDKKADVLGKIADAEIKKSAQSSSSSGGKSSSSSGSTVNVNVGGDTNVSTESKPDEPKKGYIPSISAKELAKNAVSNAEEGDADGETRSYRMSKYLLNLIDGYGLDADYLAELEFMLAGYGYKQKSVDDMRTEVLTYDADDVFEKNYQKYFDDLIESGMARPDARTEAKNKARDDEIIYIAENTSGIKEFRRICDLLGITKGQQNYFIKKLGIGQDYDSTGNGSGTGAAADERREQLVKE